MIKTSENTIAPECYWCANNVGKIALWGNILLFIVKILCGTEGDSRAVIADAVHSAADVLLAIILLICLKISTNPPDDEHPYGQGNIEYIASLFVGFSLTAVSVIVAYSSIEDIINGVDHQPTPIAFVGLIISLIGNELMFRHSLCCGKKFKSPAMIANAWENRADVYTSIAALIGVIGAQLGYLFMDPLGAIIVSLLLLYSAGKMMKDAWRGILDHSVDETTENKIIKIAQGEEGVMGIQSIKTRAIGQYMGIDLKIEVSPDMLLKESCLVCERVKNKLRQEIDKMALITIATVGKE